MYSNLLAIPAQNYNLINVSNHELALLPFLTVNNVTKVVKLTFLKFKDEQLLSWYPLYFLR